MRHRLLLAAFLTGAAGVLEAFHAEAVHAETLVVEPGPAEQIGCIAQTVYHEARGEPATGMVAVGQVAMNRARAGSLTPCQAVHSRSGGRCEFSWACGGMSVKAGVDWDRASTVAEALVLSPSITPDPTDGAMFFNVCARRPAANLSMTVRIGAHCFFVHRDHDGSAESAFAGTLFGLEEDAAGRHGWTLVHSGRDTFAQRSDAAQHGPIAARVLASSSRHGVTRAPKGHVH
jgi:spore germination cell wall hydrolase CwlJ-like protein